jgi:hypothetical protein
MCLVTACGSIASGVPDAAPLTHFQHLTEMVQQPNLANHAPQIYEVELATPTCPVVQTPASTDTILVTWQLVLSQHFIGFKTLITPSMHQTSLIH